MMLQAGIIFDFDDTLVRSHQVFEGVQTQYCRRMAELGLYDDGLALALNVQDIANVDATGYMAAHCFPKALGQTYERYCEKYGQEKESAVKEELVQLGWQVYEAQPEQMEDARQILQTLQQDRYSAYKLLLLTQGEEEIQQRRLRKSDLEQYFDAIHIVPKKNAAVLRRVVVEEALDLQHTWYVGNSLRSDINPAVEVGLRAVHLDTHGWDYEHQEVEGGFLKVHNLVEFLAIFNKYLEEECEDRSDTV